MEMVVVFKILFLNVPFFSDEKINLIISQYYFIIYVEDFFFESKKYLVLKEPTVFIFKNRIEYNNIKYLKSVFYSYLSNKIPFIISQLPLCISKEIFGQYDNLRFNYGKPELSNLFFLKDKKINFTFINSCDECIIKSSCVSLKYVDNFPKNIFYLVHPQKIIDKIKKNNLNKIKFDYLEPFFIHSLNTFGNFSFRNFQMLKSFNMDKNNFSFKDRIIYYVHFLEECFFEKEYLFMKSKVKQKEFLKIIFNLFRTFSINRYGYSLDIEDGKSRESFYLFFVNEYFLISFLNNFFMVNAKYEFEYFDFLGFDFREDNLYEIKLYSKIIENNIALNYFNSLKLDLDLFLKYGNLYLFVRRFSQKGELTGFKIEFTFKSKEFEEFKGDIFLKYNIVIENFYYGKVSIFALDFSLDGKLKKIAIYSN